MSVLFKKLNIKYPTDLAQLHVARDFQDVEDASFIVDEDSLPTCRESNILNARKYSEYLNSMRNQAMCENHVDVMAKHLILSELWVLNQSMDGQPARVKNKYPIWPLDKQGNTCHSISTSFRCKTQIINDMKMTGQFTKTHRMPALLP